MAIDLGRGPGRRYRGHGRQDGLEDDHQSRAGALAQKVEASRLERERKLRELGETYRIRVRAQLASVRLLWQPRVYFNVLLDRGPTTRSLTLAYDGLLERLELPACESCRRPTSRLRASSTAQLRCPACSGEERDSITADHRPCIRDARPPSSRLDWHLGQRFRG